MDDVEETLRVLKGAKELIRKGWSRGAMARDSAGVPALSRSSDAVCFCTVGALWHATEDVHVVMFVADVLRKHVPEARCITLAEWNDNPLRTQEEVVALYDKALLQYQPKEA